MELLLLLMGGTAAYGLVYLASCAIHPYADCKSCARSGESRSASFKGAFGNCWRCKGTGRRLRAGARLLGRKP